MSFRGINNIALDAKGRMAMPSRYRERLLEICGGHLVVTVDSDGCLLAYPLPEWEIIESKLVELSSFDRRAKSIKRLLIGYATECDMDGQGRILLPTTLRDYAGLTKKMIMIGQGKKFEIWDEKAWDDSQEALLGSVQDEDGVLPVALEELSL